MAQTTQEQRASHPLVAYNFRVTVDTQTMGFAKVSGLQREHQSVVYRHGLSFREGEAIAVLALDKYVPVTLERGVVVGVRQLHEWMESRSPRSVEVSLCDAEGRPVLTWRIARAIPTKLSAPSFDAKSNEIAVESLELKAAGISVAHVE